MIIRERKCVVVKIKVGKEERVGHVDKREDRMGSIIMFLRLYETHVI